MNEEMNKRGQSGLETPYAYDTASMPVKRAPLTFKALSVANRLRQRQAFLDCEHWEAQDWAVAMAGECGEACNLVKKLRRGDDIASADIGRELADLVTYADLLADFLGIDLGSAVVNKFNEVSARTKVTSTITL